MSTFQYLEPLGFRELACSSHSKQRIPSRPSRNRPAPATAALEESWQAGACQSKTLAAKSHAELVGVALFRFMNEADLVGPIIRRVGRATVDAPGS